MIYFDNAATSFQKPASVYRAVTNAMRTCASAGRSGHVPAMNAAEALYRCREEAAALFGMDTPERVTFTHNATQALNMAIKASLTGNQRVLVSSLEHNAVMRPLYALRRENVRTTVVPAPLFCQDETAENFRQALGREHPALVVCTHVSNVFGYRLPIEEIDGLCYERGVPLIVDASQSAGAVALNVGRLKAASFVCMPGHKSLYGPQGTGLLLCLGERLPATLLEGGTGSNSSLLEMPDFLPDRMEAGTHNVPGVAGLAAGIRYLREKTVEAVSRHEAELLRAMVRGLAQMPEAEYWADETGACQTGVISLRLKGMDSETLAGHLAGAEICTRAGLHCAPIAHDSVGTGAQGTVRVSFSAFNTAAEVNQFLAAMDKIRKLTK